MKNSYIYGTLKIKKRCESREKMKNYLTIKWAAAACFLVLLLVGVTVYASTIVSNGTFRLTAKNKWDSDSKKNYAELTWDQVPDLTNSGYTLYQSEDGTNWGAKSTKYGKSISVLNIYPDLSDSNTLKAWMDSLNLKDNSGEQLITVTSVSITQFNSNSASYLKTGNDYKYDVVMFGSWDVYNEKDLSATAEKEIKSYIESGRGVLFGHDTITAARSRRFNNFADLLGIKLSNIGNRNGSAQVKIINNGYLMKYPFELADSVTFNIPLSHTVSEYYDSSEGTKWLEFVPPFTFGGEQLESGTLTSNFYLITNGNVGKIQTGHSNGTSTIDERKIIANTLYNLSQVTLESTANDYTVKDRANPNMSLVTAEGTSASDVRLQLSATDNGTEYQWYVEADTKNKSTLKSDVIKESIVSDIAGYIYLIDEKNNTDPVVNKDSYGNVTNLTVSVDPDKSRIATIAKVNGLTDYDKWLHVKAVDRANNVSAVTHIQLKDVLPAFRITEKYVDEVGNTLQEDTYQDVARGKNYQGRPVKELSNDMELAGYRLGTQSLLEPIIENIQAHATITYIYQKKTNTVRVRWVDEDEQDIHGAVTLSGKIDSTINLETKKEIQAILKTIDSSNYSLEKSPEAKIVISPAETTVFYKYQGLLSFKKVSKVMSFETGNVQVSEQELTYNGEEDFIV